MRVSSSQDDAAAQAALVAQLRQHQTSPGSPPTLGKSWAWRRPARRQVATSLRQLATLLAADVPLVRALDLVASQAESRRLQTDLTAVATRVRQGDALAASLATVAGTFPRLAIPLVQVGEQAGLLAEVLHRLAAHLDQVDALRRKVQGALLYPVIILLVAAGSTLVLLLKVIPVFAQMFRESGVPLPVPTHLVITASEVLQQTWLGLVAIGGGSVLLGRAVVAHPRGRGLVDRLQLRLPLLGGLLHTSALARFTRSLSTLLASGVPLLPALAATQDTLVNRYLEAAIRTARETVSQGVGLADALTGAVGWPPLVVQLLRVGEETGRLAPVLAHLADYYTTETEHRVQVLTTVLEPLLIVGVAVIIGGLLIAMYLPIFHLSEVVT